MPPPFTDNISDNLEYSLQQFAAFTQAQTMSPQSFADEDDYSFRMIQPMVHLSQTELVDDTMHKPETPTRVIRPPNAYLLFNKEMRKKLKNNNPGMTVGEISKEIGIRWKSLSQTEKSSYVYEANRLKETQKALHPNAMYMRRSREELRKAGQYSKGKKENLQFLQLSSSDNNNASPVLRKRHNKRDKHPTAPKHPLSAYMWYLTEVRPDTMRHCPGSTVGQISKLCAERWNKMSEEERAPWIAKADSDKERYAREMQIYALQNDHIMGRGTRQKYRLATAATATITTIADNENNTTTTSSSSSSSSSSTSSTTTPTSITTNNNAFLVHLKHQKQNCTMLPTDTLNPTLLQHNE